MDDEMVTQDARMRLLILYLLYRGGLLDGDIQKLHAHAQLEPQERETIDNLNILGVRVRKPLNDNLPKRSPLFPVKKPTVPIDEEVSVSRYKPALQSMLEDYLQGTLDPETFPPTVANADGNGIGVDAAAQASLRTANKPTWARTRPVTNEARQRMLVFMAGGATYAESRACYEVSQTASKEVILITSHIHTPKSFLQQVRGLSIDKRRLDIPMERPPPKAPAHLFERPPAPAGQGLPAPQRPQQAVQPTQKPVVLPTSAMHSINLNSGPTPGGGRPNGSFNPTLPSSPAVGHAGKLQKKDEGEVKKKKHHFFR